MKKLKISEMKEIGYWDEYWLIDIHGKKFLYNLIASFYRRFLIKPSLNYFIKKYFKNNSKVLHAGCGGGEVDTDVQRFVSITALDFSQNALKNYKERNGINCKVILGDIRSIPFRKSSFDGVYNLGVMEHYNKVDIRKILKEFYRVLKPGGRLIIFWPPEYGLSVYFFKILFYIYKKIFKMKKITLYPQEITRLRSEKEARQFFKIPGFKVIKYYFGIRDLFTYTVIVAQK